MSAGATALMVAASKGNMEVLTLLLSHGANPEQEAVDGSTAIDWANRFGHGQIADYLQDHLSVSLHDCFG